MKLSKIIFIIAIFIFTANSVQAKKITPKRETVEWIDVWLPHTNDDKLPRVLLIGNSITRGYYPKVEKLLKGKAYVARLTTSKSLGDPALIQEINLIMSYGKFDLVHFNNGLHGWEYTEDEYDAAFPDMIKAIRKNAPNAKLIWATTTPIRTGKYCERLEERVARIVTRRNSTKTYFKSKRYKNQRFIQSNTRPSRIFYRRRWCASYRQRLSSTCRTSCKKNFRIFE